MLVGVIDSICGKDIFMKTLVFGSLNLDFIYRVPHIAAPGETLSSSGLSLSCGGKGLNQSIALAKAGSEVYLAGSIGPDGTLLREIASENGVNISLLRTIEERTGNAIIQVSDAGENSIILFGGSNLCNSTAYIDETLSHFEAGDILLLQNEINNLPYLMQMASEKGMLIALNASPCNKNIVSCPLDLVHFLFVNEIEGGMLSGTDEPGEMVRPLRKLCPQAQIILTLGEKGSLYFDGETLHEGTCFKARIVDTTGAGDTFTGYFLTAWAEGMKGKEILNLAAKASAITVSTAGAAVSIPYRSQIDDFDQK